jgi:hypothetical protein
VKKFKRSKLVWIAILQILLPIIVHAQTAQEINDAVKRTLEDIVQQKPDWFTTDESLGRSQRILKDAYSYRAMNGQCKGKLTAFSFEFPSKCRIADSKTAEGVFYRGVLSIKRAWQLHKLSDGDIAECQEAQDVATCANVPGGEAAIVRLYDEMIKRLNLLGLEAGEGTEGDLWVGKNDQGYNFHLLIVDYNKKSADFFFRLNPLENLIRR